MITLTIDGKTIAAHEHESILDVAQDNGIFMVHPAEAYVDLQKCGHDGLIWVCTKDFRKEIPTCPRACCTMDLGFVTTVM